jgi:ectoine hydroxylase-related dioxygenase (phytanoyl-CoA dioxygenase family)
MPLVDIPEDIGSMSFGSGSHSLGNIGDMAISDTSDAELKRFIGEQGLKVSGYGAMMAGDATFHAGWTLHGAKGNPTPKTREVMTVIYYEDGSRITPPINKDQENDMAENFPGLRPGNIAATDMNPIVYSRR